MSLWKKKNEKEVSDDLYQAITESDVGEKGMLEIRRVVREQKARPKYAFVADRPIRDIRKNNIESLISEDYGGGEFQVKLLRVDSGVRLAIQTFTYYIDGPANDYGETQKDDKFQELAYSALTEKIKGGNGDLGDIIKLVIGKSLDGDDQFNKTLRNMGLLKDLITPQIPTIPAETTEGKIIDALANIVPALLSSRAGGSLPSNIQQILAENPNLARQLLAQNPNLSNMPLPDQANLAIPQNTSGNGHKPINAIQAFEFFISRFKESALQVDESQLAGMIETMAVDSLLWLDPEEYHPIIKEFVSGYTSANLMQLASGFDSLMNYAGIPQEKAENIRALLIKSYQTQIEGQGKSDDEKANEGKEKGNKATVEVNANE